MSQRGRGERKCAIWLTVSLVRILPRIRPAQHIVHLLPVEQHLRLDLRYAGGAPSAAGGGTATVALPGAAGSIARVVLARLRVGAPWS